MTSLSSAVNNARKPNSKKSKDDKKSAKKSSGKSTRGFLEEGPSGSNGGSSAQQAAAGATGFTLDTNFDQMDGIISQDSLASNVHQGGYLNESANRPSTSDSLHMPHRRQGSFAHSSRDVIMTTTRKGSGDQDSGATSSQGGSPLSKDSSRRPSLAMDASIWQPGLGFKPSGPEGQNVGMGISVARPDGSYAPVEDIRPPSAGQTQHPHHRWHHDPQRRSPPDLQTTAITNAAARAAHAQQLTQQQQQQQQQSQAIDLTKKTEAGWTAPESWDVEEVTQTDADEDVSDEDAHVMSSPAIGGLVPSSPLLGSSEEYRRESLAGRQMSIRPGTSGSFGGASSLLKGPNVSECVKSLNHTLTELVSCSSLCEYSSQITRIRLS